MSVYNLGRIYGSIDATELKDIDIKDLNNPKVKELIINDFMQTETDIESFFSFSALDSLGEAEKAGFFEFLLETEEFATEQLPSKLVDIEMSPSSYEDGKVIYYDYSAAIDVDLKAAYEEYIKNTHRLAEEHEDKEEPCR